MKRTTLATRHDRRRGVILITALGIMVVLAGLALVFARNMRTEAIASANRLSYAQADAIEQGAEQWVLAMVDSDPGDAITITQVPGEAIQLGSGYFWLLRPSATGSQNYDFGIIDEAGKLNLNTASADQLLALPNMTQDVADAIYDWRSNGSQPTPYGAQSDYYESLPEPYDCKNAPYETVEELMLVKGVTAQLLFDYDLNRDGVIDDAESAAGGTSAMFNSANDAGRGIFDDLTCYSWEPNTTANGGARVNVNSSNVSRLQRVLTSSLSANRATQIISRLAPRIVSGRGSAFANMGAFFLASGMTAAEFGQVADQLTTSNAPQIQGLINVNTASEAALMCLPGLSQGDADTLIAARGTANTGSIAWVFTALPNSKALGIAGAITSRSFVYSADIVAVSGDGRSFKRVRIVVDGRQTPAKVVYRRDLTGYGWPLPPEIRQAMRAGQPPPTGYSSSTGMFGGSL